MADVYGVRELHLADLTVLTRVHTFDWTDATNALGYIYPYLYLSLYLSIYLSFYLSIYPSIYLSIYLSIMYI